MNISRMSLVRPVAVVVLAAGLAGCGVIAPTESADEIGASRAAEVSASDVGEDHAVSDDDDDDVPEVGTAREDVVGPPVPEPTSPPSTQAATDLVPSALEWSQPFYDDYAPRAVNELPADFSPLVELLPASSQLLVDDAQLDTQSLAVLQNPDIESAVRIAQSALLGFNIIVNDGITEPFASVAATTCFYCVHRLIAAYAVHDQGAQLPAEWKITLDDGARVAELAGPHHVLVEFTGEDNGLMYRSAGIPIMVDLPARGIFEMEMLFDEGQWWVLEVWGPGGPTDVPAP